MIIDKKSYRHRHYFLAFLLQLKWIILRISKKLSRRSIKVFRNSDRNQVFYRAPVLKYNGNSELLCDSCMICEQICPAGSIKISGNKDKKKAPTSFEINFKTCIFCMDCISHCPTDALIEGELNLLSVCGANDLTKSVKDIYS